MRLLLDESLPRPLAPREALTDTTCDPNDGILAVEGSGHRIQELTTRAPVPRMSATARRRTVCRPNRLADPRHGATPRRADQADCGFVCRGRGRLPGSAPPIPTDFNLHRSCSRSATLVEWPRPDARTRDAWAKLIDTTEAGAYAYEAGGSASRLVQYRTSPLVDGLWIGSWLWQFTGL